MPEKKSKAWADRVTVGNFRRYEDSLLGAIDSTKKKKKKRSRKRKKKKKQFNL